MLAVRNVIPRLPGKSIASVILKVSWIIPVAKVCPSPCIIGEQDSVHVLNLNFVLKLAEEIEVELFFFSAMTFRVDNSEMQKLKRPKFVFPSFCERFICETCAVDEVPVVYLP